MKLLKAALYLLPFVLFSQSKDGFWDYMRSTDQTITLKTKEKKIIKSESFPVGTTEVVFRITVLDDNQQVSSSLVSLLKNIPDPTGISQGSAGAIYMLSTIVGKDKCKFKIFTSLEDAEIYRKEGKAIGAIYTQDTPVDKEVKLLKGFASQTTNLWFVFESDNWLLKEKIALEVVPWVDYKVSRGWNATTKSKIVTQLKQAQVYKEVENKQEFVGTVLEMIIEKYSYKEYSELLQDEKYQQMSVFTEKSLSKIGEKNVLANLIRKKSKQLFDSGKKQEAITILIKELVDKNTANTQDFNKIGKYFLITNQYNEAERYIQKGIELDPVELGLKLNLAHVYLFKKELSKAKDIHKTYKNQNINATTTWKYQTQADFVEFEKEGVTSKDFKKILKMLE
ncbi:MAG: tetratricopeptide repeat protein [Flavobacterium sp.]|nr:tetratricopeptide repeat protein [Flavobacterium sp.]